MPGLRGNIDASGALVIVYHMDGAEPELLMGEESKYVSGDKAHVTKYARDFGKSIFDAFTYKGDINTPADVVKAHDYFARTAAALEGANRIGRITYADFKKSSKAGPLISAKPRFVPWDNNGKLGFTKGGYTASDANVEDTGVREVFEETGITIDPAKLIDTRQLILAGGTSRYAIYLYKLSDREYQTIVDGKILEKKNASRFNELHNIHFARRPAHFANHLSELAYARLAGRLVGGLRSPPKTAKRAKTIRAKTARSVKRSSPRTRRSGQRVHKGKPIDASTLYTEKQKDMLCGQHALNHLLQEQKFVSLPGRARKHRLINGQIDLQAFCRHIRSEARKELGSAANEAIDCPADGDYQADVLVRAIKDELRYTVDELPFHDDGVAELKKRLPALRPRLIGLLVNIGGYHWTAVMSRIQPKQHVYIDSLSISKSFNSLSDSELVEFLYERNPYRIYILSVPEKAAYYRCRQC